MLGVMIVDIHARSFSGGANKYLNQTSSSAEKRTQVSRPIHTITFQGCFGGEDGLVFETTNTGDNNYNLGCAEYCRDSGFIIAATRDAFCGCTNTVPSDRIARPSESLSSGPGSRCNMPCPASWSTDVCYADECCGGNDAYSVYVVGQIDVMKQLLRRIAQNLNLNNKRKLIEDFGALPLRYFQHSSGKCLGPASGSADAGDGTKLVLVDDCDEPRNWFTMLPNGALKQATSEQCIHPKGGSTMPAEDTTLVYHEGCSGAKLEFELVHETSVRQESSQMCWGTKGKNVVMKTRCTGEDSKITFTPTAKPKLTALRQRSSGKCLHPYRGSAQPSDTTKVVIHKNCKKGALWFEMQPDGSIMHLATGKCLVPRGGSSNPRDNTDVVIHSGCDEERHKFRILANGALQQITSGKCLHPYRGKSNPKDNTRLVYHSGCGTESRLLYDFASVFEEPLSFTVEAIANTITENKEQVRKKCVLEATATVKSFDCLPSTEDTTLNMQFRGMERELEYGFGKEEKPLGKYHLELDNLQISEPTPFTKKYEVTEISSNQFSTEAGLSMGVSVGVSNTAEVNLGVVAASSTVSAEMRVDGFFNMGYSNTVTSKTSESVTVTLKVPAHSTGMITFMQESFPLQVKWRATMFADGRVKVSCSGVNKKYHLSEILSNKQRELFSFGTIAYGDKEKIIAIVQIRDRDGNIVDEHPATEEEVVMVPQKKKNKQQ